MQVRSSAAPSSHRRPDRGRRPNSTRLGVVWWCGRVPSKSTMRSPCRLGSVAMDGRSRELAGPAGLRGRASECAVLDELVAAVRRGEGRSLVLRGEAGIGKTALLDYLIASASDLTVVRAVGVESEMELGFASLHQLCA